MKPVATETSDVVIVGAGAAGLFTALSLAGSGRRVTVLSETALGGATASAWAQGGLAAAVDADDSAENHARDTLKAAAGTADAEIVRLLTAAAPSTIEMLEKLGVQFAYEDNGDFKLNREACHSHRRVLRAAAGDGFGRELMRALTEAVKNTPAIHFAGNVSAERIIRRDGADRGPVQGILARRAGDGAPLIFAAPNVVLATGGIGALYAATTNPASARGRGLAMAARAGTVLSDLEFVQFHPTALDIGEDPAPLATEALRGEGAVLLNSRGERFMLHAHEMAELAPRDIVSRAIFSQMQKGQKVYLDCRHIDTSHFPALIAACKRASLDPQRQLVPVTPAAHYHMGGIATDLNGRSSLQGLWACGEVAATGLHGANRLASNSLMEAIVMGGRVAADIAQLRIAPQGPVRLSIPVPVQHRERVAAREALRHIMAELVGVVRDRKGLLTAISDLTDMAAEDDPKLADMALVARMIAVSALLRTESRGGHYRSDYPQALPAWEKRSFTTLKEIEAASAPQQPREKTARAV